MDDPDPKNRAWLEAADEKGASALARRSLTCTDQSSLVVSWWIDNNLERPG